ncbi:anthranilate phosphoribosyltransferase [Microbulbifer hydrolyticus]|uniref:Anthranilate phosphoribosyltransferase n=1 Tax=Microbulbifer hydrolyticus TaxID=48074 RepID=A0A6P1THN0_9GAMM|nr:anthranilate phosphoribosyltransferase [Microbulbifer hydrolyticus]MBB5212964.1 anthranilate phosphoribosyltransferase [Microbulbifer hydrolyticus]QHQ40332.1 anthranilate phosphoribosyltransferase [Microbulbifer hydrolyticus]
MNIQQAIAKLVEGEHLTREEMRAAMGQIMRGEAEDAQVGAFLVALRMAGESVEEITGAVEVMRELATKVEIDHTNAVDIVGTGGDGANLFNVSSASSFVAAAAGARVAKHGNRSVSSSSGAADLLEKAGIYLPLTPEQVARCIDGVGVGFMFAPSYHSAMRHAIGPRKALGLRTIFNLLGPLTNPAGVKRQVIGVFDPHYCRMLAEVLQKLGSEHVLVLHSDDGLDEVSLAADTRGWELKNGELKKVTIAPEDFGIERQNLDGLCVDGSEASLALIRDALGKRETPAGDKAADIIAMNAGLAIYVSGVAASRAEGVSMAQDAIYSGLAGEKINELAAFTSAFKE